MGIFDDLEEGSPDKITRGRQVDIVVACLHCRKHDCTKAYKTDTLFNYLIVCSNCDKEFTIKITLDFEEMDV